MSIFGYSLILLVGGIVLGGISELASFAFAPQPADFPFSFPEVSTVLVAIAAVVYILAIALDHAEFRGALFKELRGKQGSETTQDFDEGVSLYTLGTLSFLVSTLITRSGSIPSSSSSSRTVLSSLSVRFWRTVR